MAKKLDPVHPGEILLLEFLEPLDLSQYRLAKDISVPPRRINEIVLKKRRITADTALRLARFNTQAAQSDKSYFQGLASPAAAGTLVATVWFFNDQGIAGETVRWLIWLETVLLGLLMFSRVRYFSFKTWPRGDRIPVGFLFLVVLVFVLLAIDPPTVMMLLGIVYVTSGVVITMLGRKQWKSRRSRRATRKAPNEPEEP